MTQRPYNLYAGPAILPLEVIQKVQSELLDFSGTGLSILEISHRSKEFDKTIKEAEADLRTLFGVSDDYYVLFLQGGASTQFGMIPMNFLNGGVADYVDTGAWAKKAIQDGKRFGTVNISASSSDKNYNYIPSSLKLTPNAKYVHITSNETIGGIQWQKYPDTGSVPLVCDMSSDVMSRRVDISKFNLIYAGAQKNIGPSGVTLVIIKKSLVETCPDNIATMLNYKTHVKNPSLYNTPTTFGIYVIGLVMKWMLKRGGLKEIESTNFEKARILYELLDTSDYYIPIAEKDSRSIMNVTFKLKTPELDEKFVSESKKAGFLGLKGHRSVGGCRASIYNAFPLEGVMKLIEFMKKFEKENS